MTGDLSEYVVETEAECLAAVLSALTLPYPAMGPHNAAVARDRAYIARLLIRCARCRLEALMERKVRLAINRARYSLPLTEFHRALLLSLRPLGGLGWW